jgi:hypothetical protein
MKTVENASFIGAFGEEKIEQDAFCQNYLSSLTHNMGGKLGPN